MDLAPETELRLELTPEAADTLLRSELLPGDPAVAQQRSIYFDTPRQDLSAAGFSLKILKTEDRRVQTVKAAGTAAGLFARPEWEKPVDSDVPVLDDTTPIKGLLGGIHYNLGPAFQVFVERRSWTVTEQAAAVEMVLDRGEVVAGDRRSTVCEIELELKHGSPAALYSFARRVQAIVPLEICVLNKAERGYRLLGPVARFHKSEPVTLTPDMNAGAAFQIIANACLRQFRLNEVLVDHFNTEALHQARVALRRLRSAFTIHKPILEGDEAFKRLSEEVSWLAAELGAARDVDVLLARADVNPIRDGLERARDEAYDNVEAALTSSQTRALMLDLSEWLAIGGWRWSGGAVEQPARNFAVPTLDRFRRRVKKRGRDLAGLDDEARHELRKDAKKLRYASEFFASLFSEKRQRRRHKRFVDALETLQDKLGTLNDLVSVAEILSRVGLDKQPSATQLLNASGEKSTLVKAAAEAHDAASDAKPFWR